MVPDSLRNIRCAVQRKTHDGRVLHAHESLFDSRALKAVTIDEALEIAGEIKPELSAGAVADFIICSGKPFDDWIYVDSTRFEGRKVRTNCFR